MLGARGHNPVRIADEPSRPRLMPSTPRPDAGSQAPPPRPPAAPIPPAAPSERTRKLPATIALAAGFQYVHEPLVRDDATVPFLAGRDVIDSLKRRIRNSSGGSFLITGFRGAGKTTVVLRTLLEVEDMEPDTLDYLPVVLNVVRPVTIDELLFEVCGSFGIRRPAQLSATRSRNGSTRS